MLDEDLAVLYGVETKALNRAVRRNRDRFPADFMFPLTSDEAKNLRGQFGSSRWGGRRYLPLQLAGKLAELEKKYDAQFRVVFDAIRELMASAETTLSADWLCALDKKLARQDFAMAFFGSTKGMRTTTALRTPLGASIFSLVPS